MYFVSNFLKNPDDCLQANAEALTELKKQITIAIDSPQEIVDRFNQVLMWRERAILVNFPSGATLTGTCLGITSDGGLRVKTKDQVEIIHSGSLQKIDEAG